MSLSKKSFITLLLMIVHLLGMDAQSFRLFSPEVKTDYPSVVYDFLERYLFELDSLERNGIQTRQKIDDDKVVFIKGSALTANEITSDMTFTMNIAEGKSYRVCWSDTTGNKILELAFPMSYELILGKPKHIIETELKHTILNAPDYSRKEVDTLSLVKSTDDCYTQDFIEDYYIESLSTATYYSKDSLGVFYPIFDSRDKWHSAANLFMGAIQDCLDYSLLIKQNLYGFQKDSYRVPFGKWLGYCQSMKMNTFFAVEEEHEDGIKALIIAQSPDLGFNHVLSVIIPEDFITSKNSVLKATVNAYVPTQNVKNLYQQYVDKPKKKYE